jgi:hypothetical protein
MRPYLSDPQLVITCHPLVYYLFRSALRSIYAGDLPKIHINLSSNAF